MKALIGADGPRTGGAMSDGGGGLGVVEKRALWLELERPIPHGVAGVVKAQLFWSRGDRRQAGNWLKRGAGRQEGWLGRKPRGWAQTGAKHGLCLSGEACRMRDCDLLKLPCRRRSFDGPVAGQPPLRPHRVGVLPRSESLSEIGIVIDNRHHVASPSELRA